MKELLGVLRKAIGLPGRGRLATSIALYGPPATDFSLVEGIEWVSANLVDSGLPEAEWVTLNFGGAFNRQYKTYKLSSWLKRGKPVPDEALTSIQIGRFVSKEEQGVTDYVWTAGISTGLDFLLCIDCQVIGRIGLSLEKLVCALQDVGSFDYGYAFEMAMERGPVFYIGGSTLSIDGKDSFTRLEEEIAKWSHAKGEHQKLGLPVSDLIRDVFPKNFLSSHHLSMMVKGRSLKDWIETDPKRGTLKPLLKNKLWVWDVPESRIKSIRKVLGKERLLVSWGDFNTPSGGPLGHTYGAKDGDALAFSGQSLTDEERQWVADGLDHMKPIFECYVRKTPEVFDKLIAKHDSRFPELLDAAFTAWSQDANSERPAPEQVEQAFAATLGEYLIKRYGMTWYVVEDEYGRNLGICHRGKDGAQTWTYPIDVIAKRIDRKETGFIPGVVEAIGNEIERG